MGLYNLVSGVDESNCGFDVYIPGRDRAIHRSATFDGTTPQSSQPTDFRESIGS